eukprot:TRINITY_DN753_c0_g1_i1.p1 TRINITY_DN753_c0_g1~~TRINITY_DN753_c0_g1_i1.p1  ORF type:complete len:106 (+),score=16.08 TRINITY_DN753_c0_g1_i1:632-949(+)
MAAKYYWRAAEQGYSPAVCSVGRLYQYGFGVPKNEEEAVKYYRMAAKKRQHNAEFNLGWCYENGVGVKMNPREALRYYTLAASQGYSFALKQLAKMDPQPKLFEY